MTDYFGPWKMMQDQVLHMQQTALDAAFKAMGSGAQFDNAARAAKELADMQVQAWERWMALWGIDKK
ncbi:hypothetical protein O4H52_03500 [Sphingomonadaceae bacterium G21617-S1]|jgi:hypothetical protein|uniref:hypothetical protein n=1 Tax=Rhizorhabdus sp. TaxID=1968843 RepID=UPI00121757D3|nr:hypothetical protein [Rhizorhabdus sp.]MBD3759373.1 hypothetical protein [Rhizorhabdus sp.]MCZ4340658.1 hypothetical protein [Sphingomonadaceae bacterium G21617-S1]TAK17873.1 MAG: hypothetical protein EPO38_00105 [Rhizorhabdus sp.]